MSSGNGSSAVRDGQTPGGFRHEAFFYAGEEEFLAGTVSFIRDGLATGQSTLVAIPAAKIERLRAELGREAERVSFADITDFGRNPARIIPEWQRFVDAAEPGVRLRGIGEPIWSTRGPVELVESQIHEKLLNVAFADSAPLWLLCPYDTRRLEPEVIEEARRSHPFLLHDRRSEVSPDFCDPNCADDVLSDTLPPAPQHSHMLVFAAGELEAVRAHVSAHGMLAGLSPSRAADLVVAVNEIATNSVQHGGGCGVLRVWQDGESSVCEVTDQGHVNEPLAGRLPPRSHQEGQRGLWLANHLCDLVQLRSSPAGTTVRLHMRHS